MQPLGSDDHSPPSSISNVIVHAIYNFFFIYIFAVIRRQKDSKILITSMPKLYCKLLYVITQKILKINRENIYLENRLVTNNEWFMHILPIDQKFKFSTPSHVLTSDTHLAHIMGVHVHQMDQSLK